MSRIESHRFGATRDGVSKLFIVLGETYVDWLEYFRLQDGRISHFVFAYIFEQQVRTKGTDLHKHIVEIERGKDGVDPEGKKFTAYAATLDFDLDAYERSRRQIQRGDEPYPPFERV